MTPTDILAATRANPLSPIVPAREEWLRGWQGPARDGEWNVPVVVLESFGPTCLVYGNDPTGEKAEWELRVVRSRLDLRRPEVRDRLVRCGAPEWCRESVAGMLAWARGTKVCGIVTLDVNLYLGCLMLRVVAGDDPRLGFDCDPFAALRAGCVLAETDGWYIPLPDGAVGWLPLEAA